MQATKNYDYIDILRSIACFSVILLHYAGSYVYSFEIPTFNTGIQLFTVTRWCVPVFLMITGALLLGRNEEITLFYKKRFIRLLFPFLFWSAVYIAFKLITDAITSEKIMDLLLREGAEFHFWYVYLILGIILFLPFITPWSEKKNHVSIIIFLGIWLYWLIFQNTFRELSSSINMTYFSGYIGYIVLGYYFHIISPRKSHLFLGIILFFVGLAYSYYATINITTEIKKFSDSEQNYLSWNVLLMASGIFLVLKQLTFPVILIKLAKEISKYSFSIYLSHIIVRDNLVSDYFSFLNFEEYSFLLLKSLLVMIFCYVIAWILRQLPFVGKYISG